MIEIIGDKIIPNDNREISVKNAFLIFFGKKQIIRQIVNMNGETFAVGRVFKKFQSLKRLTICL